MAEANDGASFEEISAMATELLKHTSLRPKLGIICGTGLGGLADMVENPTTLPYTDIPGFPASTVKGHKGEFVIGIIGGKPVIIMRGRFHYYEGYPMWKVVIPVRVMKLIGVETLLVTNAAGGLNQSFNTGDIMVLKDHIDLPGLVGNNVLKGKNDERFGPRFLATAGTYDKSLREEFIKMATDMGHGSLIREGVYVMVGGPTFASLTESKFVQFLGADAIGMSTIPEAIVAKHGGMRVFAFSLITDMVGLDEANTIELTHDEVLEIGNKRASLIQQLMLQFINLIN